MKSFRAFLLWVALAGAAIAQPQPSTQPDPAMASFADIYRMTVSGSDPLALEDTVREQATQEAAVRVSSAVQAAPESQFRVTPAREPERWLLLVAGLALAGWVAHRRLVNWF